MKLRSAWEVQRVTSSASSATACALTLIRPAKSGNWSAPSTWEGGRLPSPGSRAQIRAGHTVRYDLASDQVLRSVHVAGKLTFDPTRDTRLDAGLLKIQPGTDASENGFDCDAHLPALAPGQPRPTLEVGTAHSPSMSDTRRGSGWSTSRGWTGRAARRSSRAGGGGINLGEGVDGAGPDVQHPLLLTGTRIWNAMWAFRPASPSMIVDDMRIHDSTYALFEEVTDRHAYRRLQIRDVPAGNRNFRLAVSTRRSGSAIYGPGGQPGERRRATEAVVERANREGKAAAEPGAGEILESADFPRPLAPVDDLPPATVITGITHTAGGRWLVRGTTSDNGTVRRVLLNGTEARPLTANVAEWEVTLPPARGDRRTVTAFAVDAEGNQEKLRHVVALPGAR